MAVHREAFTDKRRPEKRFTDRGKFAVELEKKKKKWRKQLECIRGFSRLEVVEEIAMKTDDHNHPKNDPTSKSGTCTICAAGENVNTHLNDRAQLLRRANTKKSSYYKRIC